MSASDLSHLSQSDLVLLILTLQERVLALEAENRDLRAKLSGGCGSSESKRESPSFVKPNRPQREKQARKQREKPAFRHRSEPTRVVEHAVETCPDCGRNLEGGWVARTREVIELPVVPVEIIEHRMLGRHCGVCGKDFVVQPDLSWEVLGQSRFGVGLMSRIVVWREECRLPLRVIQQLLRGEYGLHVSLGELVEVLHRVAEAGEPHYVSLREQVRGAGYVHADETGWREDGENGYLWSFSTPSVCYLERHPSRGSVVVKGVLGEQEQQADAFLGVLCSDFYSSYAWYPGEHQRCWVHFLRDLHQLKEKHPKEPSVVSWTQTVKGIYEEAKEWVKAHQDAPVSERRKQRFIYQARLVELAEPYAKVEGVAQRVLAERILRFEPELFTFVEYPAVPSENNAAERALRPSVIARKISGGTRSEKGSKTRCVLRSLLATWKLQGGDLLEACRKMLTGNLEPEPT